MYSQGQFENCIYCGDNSLGTTSSAIGNGNENFSNLSLTIGKNNFIFKKLQSVTLIGSENITETINSGNHSIALGNGNLLKGDSSVMIGNYNELIGINSYILGTRSEINSDFAASIGYKNTNTGIGSLIFGNFCEATSTYSSAIGMYAYSNGMASISIGNYSEAKKSFSYAFGTKVIANGAGSMVIGGGLDYTLQNNENNSLMIGFSSDVSTFFVSSSNGSGTTGTIGIGNITLPEAKLHIKADNNEDAAIMLQPTGSNYYGKILFGDDSHVISGKTGEDLKFNTEPGTGFVFENGDLQIQTGYQVETEKVSSLGNKLQLFDDVSGITITNGGKVGICTSSPSYSLMINGDMLVGSEATFLNSITQSAGNLITTSQIKAPDANGLKLTDQDDNGIFVDDGGNVGIGTDNPVERLQIGDRWTFHNGNSNKIIGYNFKWDGGSKRIAEDEVSIMKFSSSGNIVFQTAILGASGSPITSWNYPLTLMNDGNVGIGTTSPDQKLELSDGGIQLNGEYGIGFNGDIPYNGDAGNDRAKIYYDNDFGGSYKDYLVIEKTDNNTNTDGGIAFTTKGSDNVRDILMVIKGNGNVGIGTTTADEMLTVAGYINARQVKVDITAGGADFVFDDDYELPLLDDVDDYVNKHNHLPDIPSADEMKENGLLLGEMQIKLLQKIEEMTLYLIELKKENEDIKLKMAELLNSNNININNNEE